MERIKNEDLDLLEGLPKEKENVLRERRDRLKKGLMAALDIYDKNVLRGRIEETEAEKAYIDKWWKALKDLEPWAFEDEYIPIKVKDFL